MISYLIPDMPVTEQLIPYLNEIDNNHWYSNFGPLYTKLKQRVSKELLESVDEDRLTLVSSGSSAIELALKSLDLPRGAKVLAPSFTFPATIQAILNSGLNPIICDVDEYNWCLTPEIATRNLLLHDIAAILPVAAFGMPVSSSSWAQFYKHTGIPVVVDAAAALLSQPINDNIFYAFSLHATKPFGVGEGGLVVCPSESYATRIKKMSNFGFEPNRNIKLAGTNAKISEFHCAVGLAQIDRILDIKNKRTKILNHYLQLFKKFRLNISLQNGYEASPPASLYILFNQVDSCELFETMLSKGIETRRLYLPLIQDFPAFKDNCELASLNFKNAQNISSKGLALPFHNHLSFDDINYTVQVLSEFHQKRTSQR